MPGNPTNWGLRWGPALKKREVSCPGPYDMSISCLLPNVSCRLRSYISSLPAISNVFGRVVSYMLSRS